MLLFWKKIQSLNAVEVLEPVVEEQEIPMQKLDLLKEVVLEHKSALESKDHVDLP